MPVDFLHQDRVWIARDGDHLPLAAMDPHHRSNLIPFLRGNARTLYTLDHGLDHTNLAAIDPQAAEEWLEQTTLMRRLVELEQGRSIDERRATHERNVAHERATGYQKLRLG